MMANSYLEQYLFEHIPISQALGLKVVTALPTQVILSAPILANINHKKTVFGGSLHALATLACWSLAFINLQDFVVECRLDEVEAWDKFKKVLGRFGKAKMELQARIYQGEELAVDYFGEFVGVRL